MNDTVIRKVSVLRGRAKDEAERQGLDPDDLVIVTTSLHPLPEYHIEKIEGDPVSYLLADRPPQGAKKMKEEKYALAEAMKMKEIRIHTGIRSCPRPTEHESETHWGKHKFMKKSNWTPIETCRACEYFLAESQEHQQIICCYGVEKVKK